MLEHAGTDVIRLPYRSPNLNAYVERFVLSSKSECLERMIFFGEQSLRRAVAEFIHHYHRERNHQGLGNALTEAEECVGSLDGNGQCRKRLGSLLKYYHRDAASEFGAIQLDGNGRPGSGGLLRASSEGWHVQWETVPPGKKLAPRSLSHVRGGNEMDEAD